MDYQNKIEQETVESGEGRKGGLVGVIIGIDGYKDLRPLHCAVNDAVSLTETFKKVWPGCEITTLVWPQMEKSAEQEKGWGIHLPEDAGSVTRQNIMANVRQCAARCGEFDTFVFYFSGHGALIEDEPTLITVANAKTAGGTDHIKIRDVQTAAAAGRCKKKIMILDCCQDTTDKTAEQMGYKNLKALSDEWWIFLSCSPGERSLEDLYEGKTSDDYLQQGIFTASLVEGLRGEAGSGEKRITLAQLAYYVGERVPIVYQEKLITRILSKGEKTAAHGQGQSSQNPLLIGQGFAVSGPYQVLMAPRRVPLFQKSRKPLPGQFFCKHWFQYLFGKWPLLFPLKRGFQIGGALLYASVILLTIVWHAARAKPTFPFLLYLTAAGSGSLLTWCLTIAYAVTVNEHRWFVGGYGTLLFYLSWHGIIALWFWALFGAELHPFNGIARINFLASDLLFLFIAIVIFGCNASQTVIALAEPLRQENERRDLRQAIRVFEEFKVKTFNVSLYNYIPMVSARPHFYYCIFAGILLMVGGITIQVMVTTGTGIFNWWVLLLRNLLALVLVAWLMIWYASAFTFLQKEVYKR